MNTLCTTCCIQCQEQTTRAAVNAGQRRPAERTPSLRSTGQAMMDTPSSPSAVRGVGSSSPALDLRHPLGAEAFCVLHHVPIDEGHVVVLTKFEVDLPFDQPVDAVRPDQYDKGDLRDSGFDFLEFIRGRRRPSGAHFAVGFRPASPRALCNAMAMVDIRCRSGTGVRPVGRLQAAHPHFDRPGVTRATCRPNAARVSATIRRGASTTGLKWGRARRRRRRWPALLAATRRLSLTLYTDRRTLCIHDVHNR
jgi:hypothetical protein